MRYPEDGARLHAAAITHELTDVFTALLALTDFAAGNLPDGSPAHGDVTAMRALAARGAALVDQLRAAAAPDPTGGNETILVVEDERPVRDVICRALAAGGYTVIEAENGEAALDAAARHNAPIHLVITDVVMPEMTGVDLFARLRGWYPSMRMLFISGYARDAVPPEALAEGTGARFLAKPFTVDQLRNEVRRMLDTAPAPA